jgi:hypothetical protein
MTDVLIYWRDYRKNATHPVWNWHSNSRLLSERKPGDGLWFVTAGKNLGLDPQQAAFLVAFWSVQEVIPNPGDEPNYPLKDYRYRVVANLSDWMPFNEPVLVGDIVRPQGRDKAASIGKFLQGPRKLKDQTVRLLRAAAGPKMALNWLKGKQTTDNTEIRE